MNKVNTVTYKCSECDDMWTMYGEPISEPYCPFCGYTDNIEDIVDEILVKKESVAKAEDRITEQRCSNGGWWNPIAKECMGTGQGFNPDNT